MPGQDVAAYWQAMLNSRGYMHPFLNGRTYLYGVGELPRTLTELAMCKLSARIRRTDSWWLNINKRAFRDHWMREGVSSSNAVRTSSGIRDVQLSSKQISYVLDELIGYVTLQDLNNNCEVSCFDRIWQTSTSMPLELIHSLESGISLLGDSGTESRSGTCMDLIDPCRHPLIYGLTLQSTRDGSLKPAPLPLSYYYAFSMRFAYLPTAFAVSPASEPCRVTALGYINDLPPSLPSMYENVESVLTKALPLFEHVLTDLHRDNPLCHRIPGGCKYEKWDEPEEPEHSDDEEGWAEYEKDMRHWSLHRPIVQPDVAEAGYQGGLEHRRDTISLRGRTLKVVTRLTEIRLRPERPGQESSPWHAEGMMNEHIVACATSCIASHNMRPLNISFRMAVQAPRNFLPGDVGATVRTWGLQDGAPCHQYLGTTTLEPGQIVAYPNIYQTQFSSTHLLDSTKPGSMTILSLCLVDPDMPHIDPEREVHTTSSVPPQDIRWLRQALYDYLPVRIPVEIVDKIAGHIDWLLTEEEHQDYARKMRSEREAFWHTHDLHWFSVPFNANADCMF